MFPDSSIDPATIQAYLDTEYRVHDNAEATLRIGSPCPELAALHRTHAATCGAFITACNPYSHPLDPAANADRHKALATELTRRALPCLEGIGQHPSNQWPGEPSYLVFRIPLAAAKTLGHDVEQNAIVWTGEDAIPQLILLR